MSRSHTKERAEGRDDRASLGDGISPSEPDEATVIDKEIFGAAAASREGDGVPVSRADERSSRKVLDTGKVGIVIDGRYRITGLIGRGGMGSVYRAEHIKIHRTVAMKLLHPSLAQIPEVSQRFEREAFAIGRIEHANCVNVSDFGQLDDGSLYLVMEYLEGRALGDILAKERRLEPARTMHIVRHVLRGLGHAHGQGIVHRDVKPENVLLIEQDGDPDYAKILDFGIAKLVGRAATANGGSKLTQAGVAFGTPIYMSPEQAVGNPVDGRADLYAASVMAYEMIAGRPPFDSDDKLEVMQMHTSRPVPSFAEIAPNVVVPPPIEQLVMRGLAKRPNDRYADATQYITAIDGVIGAPVRIVQVTGHITGQVAGYISSEGPALGSGPNAPFAGTGSPPVGFPPAGPGGSQGMQALATHGAGQVMYPQGVPPGAHTGNVPVLGRRRRWPFAVGLVTVALAAAVAVVVTQSKDAPPPEEDAPLVVQAQEMIERGEPKRAIEVLEEAGELIENDSSAQLQLGHAYAFTSAERKALAAYRTALALDVALWKDASLRSNIEVMLADKKRDMAAVEASDVVLSAFGEDDPLRARAADKLVEIASKAKDNESRQTARDAADRYGLGDRVKRLTSLLLDLAYGKSCEERRKSISKLRALGDPRAIQQLKRAPHRKGRYGRWKGRSINNCLRDEAGEAVTYLESREAATAVGDDGQDAGTVDDDDADVGE